MATDVKRAESCGACGFWVAFHDQEGTCRRRSPWPTDAPEHVAHWPMTHARERCGQSAVKGAGAPTTVPCKDCVFWKTNPGGGMNPTDRFDKPMSWWKHAGLCVRRAPSPSSVPGNRAFWRATHMTDCCAEGRRPGDEPAPLRSAPRGLADQDDA